MCGGGGGGLVTVSDSCDPMDCSLPGSSLSMGFSRQEYWSGLHSLLQGIFPTQELNWVLLHCRHILYQLSYGEAQPLCERMQISP